MRTEPMLQQAIIEQRRAEERKSRKLSTWPMVNTITIGGYAFTVVCDVTMPKDRIRLTDTFRQNSLIHFTKTVV